MTSTPDRKRVVIPSRMTDVPGVLVAVAQSLEDAGFPPDDRFAVRLALDEAITNAVKHGNGQDPGKTVTVEWSVAGGTLDISVEDQGPGFDPADVPDPTLDENLSRPSGRGVMLIQAYMDKVEFNDRGNRVRMTRAMSAEGGGSGGG
ncbi:MAG: ATP-binding protein [Planctomycetota bacterium]